MPNRYRIDHSEPSNQLSSQIQEGSTEVTTSELSNSIERSLNEPIHTEEYEDDFVDVFEQNSASDLQRYLSVLMDLLPDSERESMRENNLGEENEIDNDDEEDDEEDEEEEEEEEDDDDEEEEEEDDDVNSDISSDYSGDSLFDEHGDMLNPKAIKEKIGTLGWELFKKMFEEGILSTSDNSFIHSAIWSINSHSDNILINEDNIEECDKEGKKREMVLLCNILKCFIECFKGYDVMKKESREKLQKLITCLPDLEKINSFTCNTENKRIKEEMILKCIIEIYESYLTEYDSPYYNKLLELMDVAIKFYQNINEEKLKLLLKEQTVLMKNLKYKTNKENKSNSKIDFHFFDSIEEYIKYYESKKKDLYIMSQGMDFFL